MESLLDSLPVYMMIGIVVVVGISQFNRIVGSILGIVFWIAVALVGATAYDKGGGISLLSIEFSKSGFFLFCGAFVAFNSFNLYMAMQRRRRWLMGRRAAPPSDEE